MRKFLSLLFVIAIVVQQYSLAFAATPAEKAAVYQKFFEVTGTEAQYKQMRQLIINQFSQGFQRVINHTLAKSGTISAEDQVKVQKMTDSFLQDASKQMFEMYDKELPFSVLAKNVFIPTYEKHFTVDEINKVTEFYQSPVGQKFVHLAPTMMHETATRMGSLYGKKLQEISGKVMQVEMEKFQIKLDEILEKEKKKASPAKPTA